MTPCDSSAASSAIKQNLGGYIAKCLSVKLNVGIAIAKVLLAPAILHCIWVFRKFCIADMLNVVTMVPKAEAPPPELHIVHVLHCYQGSASGNKYPLKYLTMRIISFQTSVGGIIMRVYVFFVSGRPYWQSLPLTNRIPVARCSGITG